MASYANQEWSFSLRQDLSPVLTHSWGHQTIRHSLPDHHHAPSCASRGRIAATPPRQGSRSARWQATQRRVPSCMAAVSPSPPALPPSMSLTSYSMRPAAACTHMGILFVFVYKLEDFYTCMWVHLHVYLFIWVLMASLHVADIVQHTQLPPARVCMDSMFVYTHYKMLHKYPIYVCIDIKMLHMHVGAFACT